MRNLKNMKRPMAWMLTTALMISLMSVPVTSVRADEIQETASVTDAESTNGENVQTPEDTISGKVSQKVEEGAVDDLIEAAPTDEKEAAEEAEAFDESVEMDGFKVEVSADEGVFPAGSTLKVDMVSEEQADAQGINDAVEAVSDDDVDEAVTFDVAVLDETGDEVEPDTDKGTVKLAFTSSKLMAKGDDADIYSVEDGVAKELETQQNADTLSVTTDNIALFTITLPKQTEQTFNADAQADTHITAADMNMAYGDVTNVNAEFDQGYDGTVRYSVDQNPDVVSVDSTSGDVTALKPGTARVKITASATENWKGATKTINVIVAKRDIKLIMERSEKLYGDPDPTFTCRADPSTPFVIGDTFDNSFRNTTAIKRQAGEEVGFYEIYPMSLTSDKYNVTNQLTGSTLTIYPRPVTLHLQDATKTYGDEDPDFEYSVASQTPLPDGVSLDDIIEGKPGRIAGEDVGEYKLNKGTLKLNLLVTNNYELTVGSAGTSDAKLTIEKKNLAVKPKALQLKVYGEDDPKLKIKYSEDDLAECDKNKEESEIFTGELERVNGEDVGTYEITQGTLDSANYNLLFTNGEFGVLPRPVKIHPTTTSKFYGDADPTITWEVDPQTPLVNRDKKQMAFSGNLVRANNDKEAIGEYKIKMGTLTSKNYLPVLDGTKFKIKKRPVTLIADDKTKVYGDADGELTYSVDPTTPLAFDEDINDPDVISGSLKRESGEAVGEYAIKAGLFVSSNYDVTVTEGTYTIEKKPITIKAVDDFKFFGMEDPEFGFELAKGSKLVDGDELSEQVTATLYRDEGEKLGKYAIHAKNIKSDNYDVTFEEGTFEIRRVESGVTFHTYYNDKVVNSLSIANKPDDILDDILTDDDWNLADEGAGISVEFCVDDSKISDEDKAKILAAAGEGYKYDKSFNVEIVKEYYHLENSFPVEEVSKPITFTVGMTSSPVKSTESTKREYKLITIHNGEAKAANGKVSDDGSSIEVTSCEYSTFAVVYKDVDLSAKTAKAATAARAARGIGGRGRYRTGDVAPIALIVGLLAVSAAGIGFIIYRKKKSK